MEFKIGDRVKIDPEKDHMVPDFLKAPGVGTITTIKDSTKMVTIAFDVGRKVSLYTEHITLYDRPENIKGFRSIWENF